MMMMMMMMEGGLLHSKKDVWVNVWWSSRGLHQQIGKRGNTASL
jgi:hypothetical protein